MISDLSDLDIVARTLYGEARGEVAKVGIIALEAIASVIWNRLKVNPKRFGSTPKEVCLKPYQFSCWNINDPNLPVLLSPLKNKISSLCYMVAEEFLTNKGIDVTNYADHYHSRWIQTPSWAEGCLPVVDIGTHRFYRLAV